MQPYFTEHGIYFLNFHVVVANGSSRKLRYFILQMHCRLDKRKIIYSLCLAVDGKVSKAAWEENVAKDVENMETAADVVPDGMLGEEDQQKKHKTGPQNDLQLRYGLCIDQTLIATVWIKMMQSFKTKSHCYFSNVLAVLNNQQLLIF